MNERKFDADAVSDLLALKRACQLTDAQVKEVLREISSRIFKKYGILMTESTGLTAEAVTKKAAERAVFSKLLYLAELPEMVEQEEDNGNIAESLSWQIQEIFGATSEDAEKLRIKTLSELEAQDFEKILTLGEEEAAEEENQAEGGAEGVASA